MAGLPWALSALKAVAAAWLLYSATRLWSADTVSHAGSGSFRRVLITTLLNPKAMLVGTTMIPEGPAVQAAVWIGGFVVMACLAGLCWVAFGANLPRSFKPYAYKVAALVLGLFSLIAASGAVVSA